jgi:hypothetical protein
MTQTDVQKWIAQRIGAVSLVYSTYDALIEVGVEVPDRSIDYQVRCPWHGTDNKPSARYYGSGPNPHFYCFKCKIQLNSVGIYAKHRSISFMEGLKELERRFSIKISKSPDHSIEQNEPSVYDDIPTLINIIEKKLARLRDKCPMNNYVKFCRLMDTIQYDYDATSKATPEMISALKKLISKMDDVVAQSHDQPN